ncbi:MAG: 1-phosphofructokinase [Huintestinicola sp.]
MIYTVTFNPAVDYVMRMNSELTAGATNRSVSEEFFFGGKGINVSIVLAALGVESRALGFVGGFTGAAIEDGVRAMGIDTDFVRLKRGNSRINVKIKSGSETEINGQGPEISDDEIAELMTKLDSLVKGDILILAGSVPSTLPEDMYSRILERLRDKGVRFVVDATKKLLLNVLKYRPFLIKPNNFELEEIFGKPLPTTEDIVSCAKELQEMGAVNVLVSMAEKGSVLLDEKGTVHEMGVPEGALINSVGAGDSMVAGFVAGYLKTGDYDHALRLGAAAGSATAYSDGLASGNEIMKLYNSL